MNRLMNQNGKYLLDTNIVIKDRLRRNGRPIPNNDIWIAAIAMQNDLILVTRDSHFDEVESLQTERW